METVAAPTYRFVPEVEALRGIAALSVIFEHTVQDYGGFSHAFHVIFNGRAAVVLFFVMSGFALACQLKDERPSLSSYLTFIVRRVFRLMPVIWLGLALSYGVLHLRRNGAGFEYDDLEVLGGALLFRFKFNPVYWTLYVEFWCSVAFPLLLWGWQRLSLSARCLLIASLSLLTFLVPLEPYPDLTLHWSRYLVCFCLGLFAAEYRSVLFGLPRPMLVALAAFAIVSGGWIGYWTSNLSIILIGGSLSYALLLAIVLIASDRDEQTPLRWSVLKFLGVISFGLYALHLPVAWAVEAGVTHNTALTDFEAVWFAATVCVSIAVSYVAFCLVERPLNQFGRRLSRRFASGRQKQVSIAA